MNVTPESHDVKTRDNKDDQLLEAIKARAQLKSNHEHKSDGSIWHVPLAVKHPQPIRQEIALLVPAGSGR